MGTPEVEGKPQVGTGMGELAELSGVELLACVGISGESLDLRGDCLSPCGTGPGKPERIYQWPLHPFLELPGPQLTPQQSCRKFGSGH